MTFQHFDYVIIGAGISGLTFANQIKRYDASIKILVLEKSKGCGGRMATRRTTEGQYDHGVHYLKVENLDLEPFKTWNEMRLLESKGHGLGKKYFCQNGATALAKNLAQDLNILYNFKVVQIIKESVAWKIISEDTSMVYASRIVLTAPVPQALELLDNSNLNYSPELKKIKYTKSLVFLAEFNQSVSLVNSNVPSYFVAHLVSQAEKKLSSKNTYVIEMNADWSEIYFSLDEEALISKARLLFENILTDHEVKNIQVKKWRYSRPISINQGSYYAVDQSLFLIGDGFAGPDVASACCSAHALLEKIKGQYVKAELS